VDIDLQGMRTFVVTAEELHFGRAAARLFLTQQALSKRIRRFEEALSAPLFERTTRKVELTAAGRRLLPLAREALAAFDIAVGAVRDTTGRLRIDVYDERFTPMGIVRRLIERAPGLRVEPGMRQGFAVALPALERQEIDAAFGRVHDLQRPWPPELAHRLVHLEPLHAFVAADHPLADRPALRLRDVRAGIAMPDPGGSVEWRGYLTRLTGRFGIPLRFTEPAIGLEDFGAKVLRERNAIALGEASIAVPPSFGLRRIPLVDPTPLHPWSIVWHRRNRNPQLGRFLHLLAAVPVPDPGDESYWIPDVDRAGAADQSR
jgi:DNA-binding transcriptional LysR family regulator